MGRFYVFLFALAMSLPGAPKPGGRVLLFSLDGMGYQRWAEDPIAGELTALRRVARRGVTAAGVVPHFPSTTANSHAALWTGAYGDVNGVSANLNPMAPRAEHKFTDRAIGFRAESLAAEPLWAAAARQGVKAVAYQATQAYPFLPLNSAPGAKVPPVLVNGYQTKLVAPWALVSATGIATEDCSAWKPSPAADRCFAWNDGPFRLHGAVRGRVLLVAADPAGERVLVEPAAEETEAPRRRRLARFFSEGLNVAPDLVVHFRLFALSADAAEFLLLTTPIHELGFYNGTPEAAADRRAMLDETGAFAGNGPLQLFHEGALGKPVSGGGDGTAERRLLEGIEFVVRQNVLQTEWLWRRYSPWLLAGYLNYPDEIDHAMLGYVHPSVPGVPADVRERYKEFRRWGYVVLNRALEEFLRLWRRGDSIVFASDHGMAPVWKQVNVNVALRRAGFQGKAVHVYNFLMLNTDDWKGGTIPRSEREQYTDRAQAALAAVKDPDSGEPVFRNFARPSRDEAKFGIGGPTGGDLYWDLAPGYYFTNAADGPLISSMRMPAGNHGFLPTRADMLAICIGAGPRLPRGGRWPLLHGTDIAPLVADLLGIAPPAQARGRSPLR